MQSMFWDVLSKPLDTISSQDYLTVSRSARHAGAEVETRYGSRQHSQNPLAVVSSLVAVCPAVVVSPLVTVNPLVVVLSAVLVGNHHRMWRLKWLEMTTSRQ